jgi:cyclase
MLRKRLIVVLTLNDGVLFRTRNFVPDYRYTLNFVDTWLVDEVVALDITRPGQGDRTNFYDAVEQLASSCFVPLAVGGGVTSLEEVRRLMSAGADKVVVNSEAYRHPDFIGEIASSYGSQCAVVSIDAKDVEGDYRVFTDFGRNDTGMNPAEWAGQCESLGAGEIIVSSIDRDGMLEGYDNKLNASVAAEIGIPLLVCGGAGAWKHFSDGFKKGGADAVCTTNIYHFTDSSIKAAKTFLARKNIPIRA